MTDPIRDFERASPVKATDRLREESRNWRENKKLTQVEVAKRLGITQGALSAFETGVNRSMRPNTMSKLHELVREWKGENRIVPFAEPKGASIKKPSSSQRRGAEGTRASESGQKQKKKRKLGQYLINELSDSQNRRKVTSEINGMDVDKLLRLFDVTET